MSDDRLSGFAFVLGSGRERVERERKMEGGLRLLGRKEGLRS